MSWIAAPAGLYARFKHEATAIDPQEFSYNRVFAFDENGNALIIDHAGKTLMPAKDITNFDGLSEHGGGRYEITQAIPAPPGLAGSTTMEASARSSRTASRRAATSSQWCRARTAGTCRPSRNPMTVT